MIFANRKPGTVTSNSRLNYISKFHYNDTVVNDLTKLWISLTKTILETPTGGKQTARMSRTQMLYKIGVFKDFAKFIGKHLC